ncbi:hypothetical protein D3C87_1377600 [compost metagenome]
MAVDQLRVDGLAVGARQFQFARGLGRQVMDQRIGRPQDFQEGGMAVRMGQVDADAFLAMAISDEGAAGPAANQAARGVAARRFHLDDLGAQLRQDVGSEGRGKHGAQFDDSAARKRGGRHGVSGCFAKRMHSIWVKFEQ